MEAKAVRVDTQLWCGRHGSARQALQAQFIEVANERARTDDCDTSADAKNRVK